MTTRILVQDDLLKLKQIHEKHFQEEFQFPDFSNKFLSTFAVEDSDGIVTAGGVRTITELVLITDKDRSPLVRRDALVKALAMASFTSSASGYDSLHCFAQGEQWVNQIQKHGFRPCVGKALVYG